MLTDSEHDVQLCSLLVSRSCVASLEQLSSLANPYRAERANIAKPGRHHSSKCITMRQAENMMEAVQFARSIGLPLVAHLTIHWGYTDVGDDQDGKLFAKLREGLDKWARRRGFPLAGIWARERMSGGQAEVEHCHLLFHLPVKYRTGKGLSEVEAAIYRLINKHGRRTGSKPSDGYWADEVVKLVIHYCPDGKYLIKGGGPDVWERFGVRREHRRLQGLIQGKRCGTTENIGRLARERWETDEGWEEDVRARSSGRPRALATPQDCRVYRIRPPTNKESHVKITCRL
ncbi:hypothetical protein [Methyloceanibacter sp. wino2]|uniref:hypothetical protein n=1 Tax=Methyloceanibacter sp. wino2 TaxID=2170729 RepID=UPI00131F0436|nr:hypothetical protein [Methyloceanibacter sp. wino2]